MVMVGHVDQLASGEDELLRACGVGDLPSVVRALALGADPNATDQVSKPDLSHLL